MKKKSKLKFQGLNYENKNKDNINQSFSGYQFSLFLCEKID